MSRSIVLSNGSMHVGLNNQGLLHDFYFPYVGLENHTLVDNSVHQVAIRVDGVTSYLLTDNNWKFEFSYFKDSLIDEIIAINNNLKIKIVFNDFIDAKLNAFIRNIKITNLDDKTRDIRLFVHQAFVIGEAVSNMDTAQYLPSSKAIMHYKGHRVFIASGIMDDKPFDQYSIGLFGIEGLEGSYRDADDGELSMSSVEHGQVDSIMRFKKDVASNEEMIVNYWISAGTNMRDALDVHNKILEDGAYNRQELTIKWWRSWLKPAEKIADQIPSKYKNHFIQSLMLVKSQIDNSGAILASSDNSVLKSNRDAYCYCWPRDGAFILWPLIRLGFYEEPYNFFRFCKKAMHPNGYLMHKYLADGSVGSSWHPYLHKDGVIAPPIQEDETALVVYMFAQFYFENKKQDLLEEFYESMIKPMANWMTSYINDDLKLPKPSYDLWEQYFVINTFTVSAVYSSLLLASSLAESAHDEKMAVIWRSAAEEIKKAANVLYDKENKMFYRSIKQVNNNLTYDKTIDVSSFYGSFMFGLFSADSNEIASSFETIKRTFNQETNIGVPRFLNDYYYRTSGSYAGNYWFVSSLWLAQYYLEKTEDEQAELILDWVTSKMEEKTSILAEQYNPELNKNVSVAPLTWSSSEYVATLLDYISPKGV